MTYPVSTAAVLAAMGVGLALSAPGAAQAAGAVSGPALAPIPAVAQADPAAMARPGTLSGARLIETAYLWQMQHHHRHSDRLHRNDPNRFANRLADGSKGWVDGCNAGWSWKPGSGWTYNTWPCDQEAALTGQSK